jgi:hypothetical protein
MRTEKEIMKQISHRLDLYKSMGQVEWWSRLQSGKVKNIYSNSWIKLCDKGTPDFLALVNGKESLIALFIEAKSSSGKLRKEQLEFINRYQTNEYINVVVIKDIEDLIKWIDLYAIDITEGMNKWNQD